jgi:hypothetical protein
MIRLTQTGLAAMAATRGEDFRRAVLAVATVDGETITLSESAWRAAQRTYPPGAAPPKPRGLGDVVALFAEPIARASDAVLGTKLVGCNACAERRAALNKLVPDL